MDRIEQFEESLRTRSAEFSFKLGMLLGTLDDFLIRVQYAEYHQSDIDRVITLSKDVKKKFYALTEEYQ